MVLTTQRFTAGTKVIICRPVDPEAKGLVERAHDYLERSLLPGRAFVSPVDVNAQLQGWLELVNQRTRRALGCAPADRIVTDRAAMLACRRRRRRPAGGAVSGWPVSIASVWTATTTLCTRRWSATGSR